MTLISHDRPSLHTPVAFAFSLDHERPRVNADEPEGYLIQFPNHAAVKLTCLFINSCLAGGALLLGAC